MRKSVLLMAAMLMVSVMLSAKDKKQQYVATWTTAIQKVEPHNLAPAPYLSGNSLRQIVEVSFVERVQHRGNRDSGCGIG